MTLPSQRDMAQPSYEHPSLRENMESIASALGLELGEQEDAGLAWDLGERVSATIAPGRNGRLTTLLWIADVRQMPQTLLASALAEAAQWGVAGERQRFVVVDGHFCLLWTTTPMPSPELLEHVSGLFATAVTIGSMVPIEKD